MMSSVFVSIVLSYICLMSTAGCRRSAAAPNAAGLPTGLDVVQQRTSDEEGCLFTSARGRVDGTMSVSALTGDSKHD
jgi:hypothetical protein